MPLPFTCKMTLYTPAGLFSSLHVKLRLLVLRTLHELLAIKTRMLAGLELKPEPEIVTICPPVPLEGDTEAT